MRVICIVFLSCLRITDVWRRSLPRRRCAAEGSPSTEDKTGDSDSSSSSGSSWQTDDERWRRTTSAASGRRLRCVLRFTVQTQVGNHSRQVTYHTGRLDRVLLEGFILIISSSVGARVLEQGRQWAVFGGGWRARGARAYNVGLGAEPPVGSRGYRGIAPG